MLPRLLLLPLLFLSACATVPPPFTATETEQAQVRWRRGQDALIVDAAFSRTEGRAVRVQIYKGMAKVLLSLTSDSDGMFYATGSLAGPGWKGLAQNAPQPLLVWVAALESYRLAPSLPNGQKEIHRADSRSALLIEHGRLRTLSVVTDPGGDTITAQFAR